MKKERYDELMNKNSTAKLTKEEIAKGWHYCYDWDGLLVGPDMIEHKHCNCHIPIYID